MSTASQYRWVIVHGPSPFLTSVGHLRHKAFAEGGRYLEPSRFDVPFVLDGRDAMKSTTHCIVFLDEEPVAAARLQTPDIALAAAHGTALGFGLESDVELAGLEPRAGFAEVSRVCVLPSAQRTTEAFPRLVAALVAASRVLGIREWCAAANCETDSPEEAESFHRLAQQLGRVHASVKASARPGRPPPEKPSFRFFEQGPPREGAGRASLPPVLGMYLTKLGARSIGRPFYCSQFRRYAMPIAVSVEELSMSNSTYSRWLRRLDISLPDNDNDNDGAGAPRSAA